MLSSSYGALAPCTTIAKSDVRCIRHGLRFTVRPEFGGWTEQEGPTHKCQKTLGSFVFFQTYTLPGGTAVCFAMVNTAAVHCLTRQGTSRLEALLRISEKIFTLADTAGWSLSATYIRGVQNKRADALSRFRGSSMEWTLKRNRFQGLCQQWGTSQVDLFASKESTQLNTFLTRAHRTLAGVRMHFSKIGTGGSTSSPFFHHVQSSYK